MCFFGMCAKGTPDSEPQSGHGMALYFAHMARPIL